MKSPYDHAIELLKATLEKWHPLEKQSYPIKSPKYTGEPGTFTLGSTKSGKTIHSNPYHGEHAGFSPAEHSDAFYAHKRHLESLPHDVHPGLVQHHQNAMAYHRKQAAGVTKIV